MEQLIWESFEQRDRDDSDEDANINRIFGINSSPSSHKCDPAVRAAGEYSDLKVIGSGSFGIIYSGVEVESGEKVAIKVESASSDHHQLYNEYQVYSRFLDGLPGFPRVYRWAHTKRLVDLQKSSIDSNSNANIFEFPSICHLLT